MEAKERDVYFPCEKTLVDLFLDCTFSPVPGTFNEYCAKTVESTNYPFRTIACFILFEGQGWQLQLLLHWL